MTEGAIDDPTSHVRNRCTENTARRSAVEEMRTGMEEFPPTSEGSAQDIARVRIAYAKEAEPLGTCRCLLA